MIKSTNRFGINFIVYSPFNIIKNKIDNTDVEGKIWLFLRFKTRNILRQRDYIYSALNPLRINTIE